MIQNDIEGLYDSLLGAVTKCNRDEHIAYCSNLLAALIIRLPKGKGESVWASILDSYLNTRYPDEEKSVARNRINYLIILEIIKGGPVREIIEEEIDLLTDLVALLAVKISDEATVKKESNALCESLKSKLNILSYEKVKASENMLDMARQEGETERVFDKIKEIVDTWLHSAIMGSEN